MKELSPGKLQIVGTGFYVTRYGLFVTAAHVLRVFAQPGSKKAPAVGFVFHVPKEPEDVVHLRRIRRISYLLEKDVGMGQAENYQEEFPDNPLINMRAKLTTVVPDLGEELVTFAYPDNEILDFSAEQKPVVQSDFFKGAFLEYVTVSQNPNVPYPHYETSIEMKSGASGGPVCNSVGQVVAVNCRGWDFRGAEHESENLSIVVPISALLPLEFDQLQLPPESWEAKQIPPTKKGAPLTVKDLAQYGHIQLVSQ